MLLPTSWCETVNIRALLQVINRLSTNAQSLLQKQEFATISFSKRAMLNGDNSGSPELFWVSHFGEVKVFNLRAVFEIFTKICMIV
jgi:hypothetical protein